MSHFAQVINGIVEQVIVAEQDFIDSGAVGDPSTWIQTSYNTRGGIHYDPVTALPSGKLAFRANYAGLGYTYDVINDVFYAPQPIDHKGVLCSSWTISTPTWEWTPPIAMPILELSSQIYVWDETTKSWLSTDQIIDPLPPSTIKTGTINF